jgi:hypothetical protein
MSFDDEGEFGDYGEAFADEIEQDLEQESDEPEEADEEAPGGVVPITPVLWAVIRQFGGCKASDPALIQFVERGGWPAGTPMWPMYWRARRHFVRQLFAVWARLPLSPKRATVTEDQTKALREMFKRVSQSSHWHRVLMKIDLQMMRIRNRLHQDEKWPATSMRALYEGCYFESEEDVAAYCNYQRLRSWLRYEWYVRRGPDERHPNRKGRTKKQDAARKRAEYYEAQGKSVPSTKQKKLTDVQRREKARLKKAAQRAAKGVSASFSLSP